MKKFTTIIAVTSLAGVLFGTQQAEAQFSPVRLKVNRVSKKDRKTTSRSTEGDYRRQAIDETTYYTIEVTNASTAAVPDVTVKWAVLIKGSELSSSSSRAMGGMRIVEGDRQANLELGQKFSFDTDAVQLNATQTEMQGGYDSYSSSKRKYGAEIAGYVVEVWVGGRVVASDITPIDTKKKIEQLKAAEKQGAVPPGKGPPVRKFE